MGFTKQLNKAITQTFNIFKLLRPKIWNLLPKEYKENDSLSFPKENFKIKKQINVLANNVKPICNICNHVLF